jgi:hypothetical protein
MPVKTASTIDQTYDLLVYHGSPAGIAAAVRAAREGLRVLLVNHTGHLGGLPGSGLAVWDTMLRKRRSPIYEELRRRLFDHYRSTYGSGSTEFLDALPQRSGHSNGRFEPHVFEQVATAMVLAEPGIDVLLGHAPCAVARDGGGSIVSLSIAPRLGGAARTVNAGSFVDASYEGDLLALAGAPFRLGCESTAEHSEPHAGRRHMRFTSTAPDPEAARIAAVARHLDLRHWGEHMTTVPAPGDGEGDGIPQAINFRLTLTRDPANRIPVERPAGYDREAMARLDLYAPMAGIPRGKADFNRPQLVGEVVRRYVLAGWPERECILHDFRDTVLGALWYAQHEAPFDERKRESFAGWGLCRDEFADNGHFPYEIYLREARRLEGAYLLSEHDLRLAAGSGQAPVHADAIAVTDWYMDVHACGTGTVDGSFQEGKVMLHLETLPAQIPYRCLYSPVVPNLLVPVCCSATHLGQSAIRLEPTWMQLGEVCGLAVVYAHRAGCAPAAIDIAALQRRLAEDRHLLAFANDVDVGSFESWIPVVQVAATRGCFASYDLRPEAPLTEAVAQLWLAIAVGTPVAAAAVAEAEARPSPPACAAAFARALGLEAGPGPLRRADACVLLWRG